MRLQNLLLAVSLMLLTLLQSSGSLSAGELEEWKGIRTAIEEASKAAEARAKAFDTRITDLKNEYARELHTRNGFRNLLGAIPILSGAGYGATILVGSMSSPKSSLDPYLFGTTLAITLFGTISGAWAYAQRGYFLGVLGGVYSDLAGAEDNYLFQFEVSQNTIIPNVSLRTLFKWVKNFGIRSQSLDNTDSFNIDVFLKWNQRFTALWSSLENQLEEHYRRAQALVLDPLDTRSQRHSEVEAATNLWVAISLQEFKSEKAQQLRSMLHHIDQKISELEPPKMDTLADCAEAFKKL